MLRLKVNFTCFCTRYVGSLWGGDRRTGRSSFDRLRVEKQLEMLSLYSGLLLHRIDRFMCHPHRLLLGLRIRLSRLLPHLVHHTLSQDAHYLLRSCPHSVSHLSRCSCWTMLWNVRLVLQQDYCQPKVIRDKI